MIETAGVIGARYSQSVHSGSHTESHTEPTSLARIGQSLMPTSNLDPVFAPLARTNISTVTLEAVHSSH